DDPYSHGAYSTVGIKAAGGETATKLVLAYDADASGSGFVAGTTALRISANQAPSIQLPVGPFAVNEGGTTTLSVTAVDPEGDQLFYAWDLDGNGTFETAGQTPTFDAGTLNGSAELFVGVQVTDGRPGHEVSVTQIPLDIL